MTIENIEIKRTYLTTAYSSPEPIPEPQEPFITLSYDVKDFNNLIDLLAAAIPETQQTIETLMYSSTPKNSNREQVELLESDLESYQRMYKTALDKYDSLEKIQLENSNYKRTRKRSATNSNLSIDARKRTEITWQYNNSEAIEYLKVGLNVKEISVLTGKGERQIRRVQEHIRDMDYFANGDD